MINFLIYTIVEFEDGGPATFRFVVTKNVGGCVGCVGGTCQARCPNGALSAKLLLYYGTRYSLLDGNRYLAQPTRQINQSNKWPKSLCFYFVKNQRLVFSVRRKYVTEMNLEKDEGDRFPWGNLKLKYMRGRP